MLYSTLDLLTRATSSDLYVFCFFNLIIVIIFMGSKHDSNLDQDCEINPPTPANDSQDIEVEHSLDSSEQGTNASGVGLCVHETVSEDSRVSEDDYSDNNSDTDEKDENHEEGDDELTKRIEEFISKVNREWRAEMLDDI
ncbi:hypothetical protein CRYUN_Cryun07bG0086700 [Craigia yunnanensis]